MTGRALIRTALPGRHYRLKLAAFAVGLTAHGWRVDFSPTYRQRSGPDYQLFVLWGLHRPEQVLNEARKTTADICIMDLGWMGDRHEWSMVGFGGEINGRAVYHGVGGPERLARHHPGALKPMDYDPNGHTLVIGQVPTDASVAGKDVLGWAGQTCRQLALRGERPRFRPHPRNYPNKDARHEAAGLTPFIGLPCELAEDMAGARRVVTFSSTAGVDAALAGKPVVAVDARSMAYEVASRYPHETYVPPEQMRRQWAERLAWKQWAAEEMASGECWAAVCPPSLRSHSSSGMVTADQGADYG